MNYYLRQPGSLSIEGPESDEVLAAWLEQGKIHPESEVHEAQGQTEVTLRNSVDWLPLAILTVREKDSREPVTAADQKLDLSKFLRQQYASSYAAAEEMQAAGFAVKWICAVLLGLLLIGDLASSSLTPSGGFLLHCVLGSTGILLGFLLSAAARIYRAVLDTAVNTSRHLTDQDVADLQGRGGRSSDGG